MSSTVQGDRIVVHLTSEVSDTYDMEHDIVKMLREFDLSEAEARIYVLLTGGQAQTALHIAGTLSLPRTNVYDALNRLAERGLVERVMRHKSTSYKASPVSHLDAMIAERKRTLTSMETALVDIKKQLEKPTNPAFQTEVRYYKGVQGMRQLMWNSLKADGRGIVGYSTFGRVEVVGLEFYKRYTAAFEKKQIQDRVIVNPTKYTLVRIVDDVKPEKHHMTPMNIRVLPLESMHIAGDTMMYNNVYAVCYWKSGEVAGVEIENPDFVHTQRTIFELLWQQATELGELKL